MRKHKTLDRLLGGLFYWKHSMGAIRDVFLADGKDAMQKRKRPRIRSSECTHEDEIPTASCCGINRTFGWETPATQLSPNRSFEGGFLLEQTWPMTA